MMRMTVTVTDIFDEDAEPQEKVLYFNVTKDELRRVKSEKPVLWDMITGVQGMDTDNLSENDGMALYAVVRELILLSYGERQGNRFVKSEELKKAFEYSPEFNAVLDQLLDGDGAKFTTFLLQIMPKDLREMVMAENPDVVARLKEEK